MASMNINAGKKFISQGERGDSFFLIQSGKCIVALEKDGETFPVSSLKNGDLVGEMAILTGERRNANVYAETEVKLWRISRREFQEICLTHPDLREFLTEVVTQRFASSKRTVDRSIGKYVITDVIGQGGWSIVYKGTHSNLNMPVAIKMMKHNMAMDPDFMGKFQNEAQIIAGLNHDNIVRVHDIEHLYGTVFIVMELLEGMSLEYILEDMPHLSFKRVMDFLIQVCHGLSYAHRQGIIHQDIKPANIFIQGGDRARIVDFGLACPTGSEDSLDFAGTPHYMSPEQIEGDPVDGRTDIYSLGITAFEMATGRRPFDDNDIGKVLQAHREEPLPDPRSIDPDLPEGFCNFVQRATQKKPENRYKHIVEVLGDLYPLAKKSGVKTRPETRQVGHMMSLFVFYQDEHQVELTQVVEKFTQELKDLGADLRVADFDGL
jgi:serine/threonine protein kinase